MKTNKGETALLWLIGIVSLLVGVAIGAGFVTGLKLYK